MTFWSNIISVEFVRYLVTVIDNSSLWGVQWNRCFPSTEEESIPKHTDTLQDEGQSPKEDHFRQTSVVCFRLVAWTVQHQVLRRWSGWYHKEPAVAWSKCCTSFCLIRLEESMKTSVNTVNDLTEICASHLLNTCVVLSLHQFIGQQWKTVMSYIYGAKWLGYRQQITLHK